MRLEKNNSVLRLALNAPYDIPCVEHEAFLAEVALRTTHSIRIYERFFRWTCVPYALGFARDPLYGEIASFHHIYATAGFVHCLLDARLQALDRPRPGCLALYFNSGLWTHAGITSTSERLVSKWGGFPVYDHRLEEVPASYGDEVQFFEAPSEGIVLECLGRFFVSLEQWAAFGGGLDSAVYTGSPAAPEIASSRGTCQRIPEVT